MFSPLEQFDSISLFNLFFDFSFIFYNLDLAEFFIEDFIEDTIADDFLEDLFFIEYSFIHILMPLPFICFLFIIYCQFSHYFTLIPSTIFQRLVEYKLKFNFNLIKQQIGSIGYSYIVLIFSLFFFVLFLNLLSLLPFGIALTSHLIVILYLSLSICIGIFFEGYIILGVHFLKIFLPKCPIAMLPLLLIIELFSYIIRMFSLAIRLVANIMAGHTLIYIISTFTLLITSMNFFFLFIGIGLILVIMLLELGVAGLQAYVFTILTLIYINDIYGSH